jgi:hypothetical protein
VAPNLCCSYSYIYLVTLGVTVTRPSNLRVTNPPLVVVVKSHTYLPSVKAAVTVSVSVIEHVPSVPLTIAVVNDVALDDR